MTIETQPVVVEYDRERFSGAPVVIDAIIRKRLSYLGEYMVQWISQHATRDTSLHVESLRYDITSTGDGVYQLVVSSSAPAAKYAMETGRGPGGELPLQAILGWVQRRGITSEQTKSVRTVGKRIGLTYRKRKNARSVARRIGKVTSQFSEVTTVEKRAAFRVMTSIARRGTKSKPLLFSEVMDATRSNQVETWVSIEADIAAGI